VARVFRLLMVIGIVALFFAVLLHYALPDRSHVTRPQAEVALGADPIPLPAPAEVDISDLKPSLDVAAAPAPGDRGLTTEDGTTLSFNPEPAEVPSAAPVIAEVAREVTHVAAQHVRQRIHHDLVKLRHHFVGHHHVSATPSDDCLSPRPDGLEHDAVACFFKATARLGGLIP
jgi:hypothetical protein